MRHHPETVGAGPVVLVIAGDPRRSSEVAEALASVARVSPSGLGEAAAALEHGAPIDVLVVAAPPEEAPDACLALSGRSRAFVPVLAVLPQGAEAERDRALQAGAYDALLAPTSAELRHRVQTLARLRALQLRREREVEQLRKLASFKDDLVSLILHDLRNPLAGIIGFLTSLDVATRAPAHAELREDVSGAQDCTRRLHDALGELLEIRMLEEGALPLRRRPTRLRELARSAMLSLEGVARERSVRLLLEALPDDEAVVDARVVGRALENLIANALRYSPAGAQVAVAARQRADGAVLEVADGGPGIPDAAKASLFEKFHTLEADRGEVRRGFGLGLYQVRLAVEAHGGRARVRDRTGGGAVFELWFPPR